MSHTLLVTGGAGFIGSALVRKLVRESRYHVVNIDKLTYAGSLENLVELQNNDHHTFVQADVCDEAVLKTVFEKYKPVGVMHLAAESHVDRSLSGPAEFLRTNIMGTFSLLEASRHHFASLDAQGRKSFRFHHISTDEVYGTLGETGAFSETTPYAPNSPYSASKASSDHLVRAWHHSYGVPVLITNCSNNYGPFQFPEKLIPVAILKALRGEKIPVYGNGRNVRDWLFVDDHCSALMAVFEKGRLGETYNIGCENDVPNLEVIQKICEILDGLAPKAGFKHESLISFVTDRAGHDFRYAIDASKISSELGWKPEAPFAQRLKETVQWYLNNLSWCEKVMKKP
jgi:dTDP-glucose 4,6-dehydratase